MLCSGRRLCFIIAASLFVSYVYATGPNPITFLATNGQIYGNGKPFSIKGLNWFGFETETLVPHGLWAVPLKNMLDFIQQNGFNAVRIPFCMEIPLEIPLIPGYTVGPVYQNQRSFDTMKAIIQKFAERNILVMLDFHKPKAAGPSVDLWYGDGYTEAQIIQGWSTVAREFCGEWNFFAADLKNEPKGAASWATNDGNDWGKAATKIGNAVLDQCSRLLIFVEGVSQRRNYFWGSDFNGYTRAPITLSVPRRLVLSPHIYGPGVANQTYFTDPTFSNMFDVWERQIGWLPRSTGAPVVLGEWGSWYDRNPKYPSDKAWMDRFASWILSKRWSMGFYWSLNPNSGDTGGLLRDDWVTPENSKLAVLAQFASTDVSSVLYVPYNPPAVPTAIPTAAPPTGTPWIGVWHGIKINAGDSDPAIDEFGSIWLPDSGFVSGNGLVSAKDGMSLQPYGVVYGFERYGKNMTYTINIPVPGVFIVNMYFAEQYYRDPERRIFSVSVQGQKIVEKLDLIRVAGLSVPYIITQNVVFHQPGNLVINLQGVTDTAVIDGISVDTTTITPPPPTRTRPIPTVPVTPTPRPIPTNGLLIDSGSVLNRTIDQNGYMWVSDAAYCLRGSVTGQNGGQPIFNAPIRSQEVFQTERSGSNFICNVPVADAGDYDIYLYFAEFSATAARQRIFSVSVQGAVAVNRLDIFAETGGRNLLLTRVARATNVRNSILISFVGYVGSAQVVAMALVPISLRNSPTQSRTVMRMPTPTQSRRLPSPTRTVRPGPTPKPTMTLSGSAVRISGPVVGILEHMYGVVYQLNFTFTLHNTGAALPSWPLLQCRIPASEWLNRPNVYGYTTGSLSGSSGLVRVSPTGSAPANGQKMFALNLACLTTTQNCPSPTCSLG